MMFDIASACAAETNTKHSWHSPRNS